MQLKKDDVIKKRGGDKFQVTTVRQDQDGTRRYKLRGRYGVTLQNWWTGEQLSIAGYALFKRW